MSTEQAVIVPEAKALTLQERVALALRSAEREKQLTELAGNSTSITSITNGDGLQQCHAARMTLKRTRIEIKKVGEAARQDARDFAAGVIDEETRLIGLIEPEEKRLQGIQDDWERREEEARQAVLEAERLRKEAIQERIEHDIRGAVTGAAGRPASEIAVVLRDIETMAIDESFAELKSQAEGAKATTVIRLRLMLGNAVTHEAEQDRLRIEREAAEQRRIEEEKRLEAEREQLAQQQREEDERRQRNEIALQEVLSIQHQVLIADTGRAPYIKGGTVDGLDTLISETEAWPVTEEHFGALFQMAANTKEATLLQLRSKRQQIIDAAALAVQAEAERAKREAEEKRLADERAELDRIDAEQADRERLLVAQREQIERSQEALRKSQEETPPPVLAPAEPEILSAPEPEAAPQSEPQIEPPALPPMFVDPVPITPSDEEIVAALMQQFGASRDLVLAWLDGFIKRWLSQRVRSAA